MEIARQVHHHRLHRLVGRIEDMDALHRTVALVDIIKLNLLCISLELAQHLIVSAREFLDIAHHLASHRHHERFVGGIAIEQHLLLEGTHLLGIIHRLHHEALASRDALLRIFHRGTTATLIDVLDDQRLVALVLHLELSGHRMTEDNLSAVHHLMLSGNLLSRCRQRQQR